MGGRRHGTSLGGRERIKNGTPPAPSGFPPVSPPGTPVPRTLRSTCAWSARTAAATPARYHCGAPPKRRPSDSAHRPRTRAGGPAQAARRREGVPLTWRARSGSWPGCGAGGHAQSLGRAGAGPPGHEPAGRRRGRPRDGGQAPGIARRSRDAEPAGHRGDDSVAAELTQAGHRRVVDDLEVLALLGGEFDDRDAIVTIHPGAGGDRVAGLGRDALADAALLGRSGRGFKVTVNDYQEGDEAGIKSVTMTLEGPRAYGLVSTEIGTHRLVHLPTTRPSGVRTVRGRGRHPGAGGRGHPRDRRRRPA